MHPHLLKLVMLTLIAALILPVGWCCRTTSLSATAADITHSCCKTPMAGDSDGLPAAPVRQCCCVPDLNVAPEGPQLPVPDVAVATEIASILGPVLNRSLEWVARVEIDPGPRLNILLCVWRC